MGNKRLDCAIKAIKTAGDYLKEQFLKRHDVLFKKDKTILLNEDLKTEEILITSISRHFPSDSFFTEEQDTKIVSDYIWVIDPLCGSYSYLRGVETWSLSIALVSDNSYVIGVVYQPLLNNLFFSQKGKGAHMNGKKIQTSDVKKISNAFVSIEHGVFKSDKIGVAGLIEDIKRLRVGHGSGAELSYVAAGFLDAVIKTDQTLEHFAGGSAILEEAGGRFVDFTGSRVAVHFNKNKKIDYIACNQYLVNKLLSYVYD